MDRIAIVTFLVRLHVEFGQIRLLIVHAMFLTYVTQSDANRSCRGFLSEVTTQKEFLSEKQSFNQRVQVLVMDGRCMVKQIIPSSLQIYFGDPKAAKLTWIYYQMKLS